MTGVAGLVLAAVVAGPAVVLLVDCSTLRPIRPGPVEFGAICAVSGATVGLALMTGPARPALLPLAVLGSAAAVVDAREGRLPDRLTGPLLVLTLAATLLTGGGIRVIVVAASGTAVVMALKLVASGAIGWGDVKLVPSLALVVAHHDAVIIGAMLACVLIALTAVAVRFGGENGGTVVPYGPALVLGAVGAAAF